MDYNSTTSRFSVNFSFGAFGFDGQAVMTLERTLPGTISSPILGFANQWTDTVRSIESVITGQLGDTVTGNDQINRIATNGGDDIIRGRGLSDDMDGGAGNDTFIYESWEDSKTNTGDFGGFGGDLIRNFGDTAGNQDVIDLHAVDANLQLFARGNEDFRADDGDGQAEVGELFITRIFDVDQDRRVSAVFADVTGEGRADFVIRFDRVIATLDVSDFVL